MLPPASIWAPRHCRLPTELAVATITALGLALRMAGISHDLWIDEIATLTAVRATTLGDLLGSYGGANQHTLNSVLAWVGIRAFGESEWAVRLSAVLFGAATVPVFYWVARLARFTRRWALFGTTLLAISSHHVWFSVNARGYAGYLLFSLLSAGALVRVLETGALRWVVLFVVVSGLNFLALLPSVFIFGAQALAVGGLVMARRMEATKPQLATARAVLMALAGSAALALVIFLPLVQEMFDVLGRTAPTQVTAFRMLSLAFLTEILHGLAPGVPPALFGLAVVPAALGLWGLARLARQAPLIVAMLLGGHLLFCAAILLLGWPIYPRLFILLLPLGLLALLGCLDAASRIAASRTPQLRGLLVGMACTLLLGVFMVLLRPVLAQPKQPFRAALAAAWALAGSTDEVLVVGVADRGIEYYARQEDRWIGRLRYARTLDHFQQALTESSAPRVLLLSTFDAALAVEQPEVWARMTAGWTRERRILGTVRGGALTIWTPRGDSLRTPNVTPGVR
jgi:mannosyltransferase